MRALPLLLLFPLIGVSQSIAPPPLLRGVLLECDAQVGAGEFSLRAADNHVFRYQFDRKTYVERESRSIDIARLNPGDTVEVVSDATPGSLLRYARTIHVVEEPPRPAQSLGRVRMPRPGAAATSSTLPSAVERLSSASTLSFSGVIFRLSPDRLVLHLRTGDDQTILLRKDTRFLQDGEVVEFADLRPNMRVFVRAGKDLYQQTEAYQVIWGVILPR
jgi:hypothetical protein